jgi:hypothetical protein
MLFREERFGSSLLDRAVARHDNLGLGGGVKQSISKEIRRAEHEYMNMHTPPPPIIVLATALLLESNFVGFFSPQDHITALFIVVVFIPSKMSQKLP